MIPLDDNLLGWVEATNRVFITLWQFNVAIAIENHLF